MNPDQTAPDLGPYCLQCRPPKYIHVSRRERLRADDNCREKRGKELTE